LLTSVILLVMFGFYLIGRVSPRRKDHGSVRAERRAG
jgi:hypothetical protein